MTLDKLIEQLQSYRDVSRSDTQILTEDVCVCISSPKGRREKLFRITGVGLRLGPKPELTIVPILRIEHEKDTNDQQN